jgi:hypothetical protein
MFCCITIILWNLMIDITFIHIIIVQQRRTLIQHVATRLREVHSLRTLHKQLTQLLSINEQDELRHELVFIFNTVKIIFMNEYCTV